jgi:hypothetical protein
VHLRLPRWIDCARKKPGIHPLDGARTESSFRIITPRPPHPKTTACLEDKMSSFSSAAPQSVDASAGRETDRLAQRWSCMSPSSVQPGQRADLLLVLQQVRREMRNPAATARARPSAS